MTDSRRSLDEDAARRFHAQLRSLPADRSGEDLYPSRLARAAALTLGADGAGLSLIDEQHRVPIGASDAPAITAERLQFTIGDGPCLDALRNDSVVRVDEDQMRVEWPVFHAEFMAHSPYRSVVAVPMGLPTGLRGALDVYFSAATMPAYSVVTDSLAIAAEVGALLEDFEGPDERRARVSDGGLPAWAFGPQARRRVRTWIAVGIIVMELDVSTDAALDRLRGHAFSQDLDVEALAVALVSGAVQVAELDAG